MKDFIKNIQEGNILLADGALGTMLIQKLGKQLECPEYINIYRPEIIESIAKEYLDAGAQIIQTNTFGASPIRLSAFGLQDKLEKINREAVRIVKRIIRNNAYIIVSIGPTGKILKPYGDVSEEEVFENYYKQMKLFQYEDIDAICIETMTNLTEMKIAIKAAKEALYGLPIVSTMTFEETEKGIYTIYGDSIKECVEELERLGADIIGSNCGNGTDTMIKIALEFKKFAKKPLIFQPNAGMPIFEEGVIKYPETPDYMASKAKELIKMNVSIIGGCCGTTPEHINRVYRVCRVESL